MLQVTTTMSETSLRACNQHDASGSWRWWSSELLYCCVWTLNKCWTIYSFKASLWLCEVVMDYFSSGSIVPRCYILTLMHGITSFVNCYPYSIQGIAYFTMWSCFSKRGRHKMVSERNVACRLENFRFGLVIGMTIGIKLFSIHRKTFLISSCNLLTKLLFKLSYLIYRWP